MKPHRFTPRPTQKQNRANFAAFAPLEMQAPLHAEPDCQHEYGDEVLLSKPPRKRCIKCQKTVLA